LQCKKTLAPNALLCTVFKKTEAFLNNIFLNFCEMNDKQINAQNKYSKKNVNQFASKANLKMLKKMKCWLATFANQELQSQDYALK